MEGQLNERARSMVSPSLREHLELIFALASGAIVLLAWLFKSDMPHWLFISLHLAAFVIGGYYKAKEGIGETIANKELNVEILMILAAIGSAAIGYWTEGAVLIFIFALSGALETYTLNKSSKEISALMKLQPEEARIVDNGYEKVVPVSSLKVGDKIAIRASERIPADGQIIKGSTSVDESAITGESIPVQKETDAEVLAGTVALDGSIIVKVTKPANETVFQKIIALVQSAQEEKAPSQLFIERFESTYVKVVLVVVALMMFLPHFIAGWSWQETIYRAMILLVVASPCALVASIMPATLSAISNSARHGVLFKGGVHLETLSHIRVFAFDKTGTLTNGTPEVTDFIAGESFDREKVLAIAAAIEKESTHPLAQAIVKYWEASGEKSEWDINMDHTKTISGGGVSAAVNGSEWTIGKASLVGEEKAHFFADSAAERLAAEGKSIVFIKQEDQIAGLFGLKDTVREETKQAIASLKEKGIRTVMLTGDHERTARAVAQDSGVDANFAECMPEDKVQHIRELKKEYSHVAMVGDGINDAPALAAATLGIAMGEGTDAALETADVVLMKNSLATLDKTIQLSRRMNRIVKENIFFSLGVIVLLILSNFFQIIDLPLGVIGHEGSTILVILNGLRLLK